MTGLLSRRVFVKWICLALLFCVGAGVIFVSVQKLHKSWVLASAEDQMDAAYGAYTSGSFFDATNAIVNYVRYIHEHRRYLEDRLKVDYMLFLAHTKLTLMYAYANDVTNAHRNLVQAFRYHRMAELPPVQSSEFLDHVISGTEKIDSRTGVAWKTNMEFPTNTILEIRRLPVD